MTRGRLQGTPILAELLFLSCGFGGERSTEIPLANRPAL
jgi:hypothetical protein